MSIKAHQTIENSIDLKYENIGSLLLSKAQKTPNKTFIICPGKTVDSCTYKDFLRSTMIVANHLYETGLQKGDAVCLVFSNSAEFLLFYFASLMIGVVVVPINPDLSPLEIKYIIENSKAKQLYYQEHLSNKISDVENNINCKLASYPISPVSQFNSEKFGTKKLPSDKLPNIQKHDRAVIIYTSGTTGNPKGVVLSHMNIIADAYSISEWFNFSSTTRTLCVLPLHHNNGQITTLIAPLYKGGSTVIVKGSTSIIAFWELVKKYKVTWSSIMASILSILLSLKTERKDNTLKAILCGGQVLTTSVQRKFERRFKVPIFEGYGLTETTSFSCINNFPKNNRIKGSIGKPLPTNQMKIIDKNGNECAALTEGEICIKGLNVAIEYLDLPEKNLSAFRDNWFHSGDYGYKDEKGYYFFKCRKDNLIIKGGENIYPAEIENVLYQHEDVEECAVIGIDDELLGQNICAFVKLTNDYTVDAGELLKFCRHKMSSYKLPKQILIINNLEDLNEIPKGPTKKILYHKLEQYYGAIA